MKLIIQIPCFNEASTLPITLASLPRAVPGFDVVEWLVIDDGSTDDTSKVAVDGGVDHVIRHDTNRGVAQAFMTGIRNSFVRGADVIVNTEADNQYNADDLPKLVRPVLSGECGFVVGIRPMHEVLEMPSLIRLLHRFGSFIVMKASRTSICDPPSWLRFFHALSRRNCRC
jgi:glycosyltransferase involved in cell wall biosynthesis